MSDTNARRYSTGAMVFHWVIAVLVIANWQIAERAEALDMPAKIEMFGYHKAVGIMILVLTLGRLLWRFTHPVPPLPATISGSACSPFRRCRWARTVTWRAASSMPMRWAGRSFWR